MQPYDLLMLAVLVGAGVFGAWKGMAWQLASIGSLLVSSIVALRFSGVVAPWFSAEEPWNRFLAMAVLFAATSLGVWISFRFVARVIDRVKLKEFDRQMGALFGLAKGVLFCLVITFFAVTLHESTRQRVLDSRSGTYAALLIRKGEPLMPEDVRGVLGKYIDRLDAGLKNDPRPSDEPIGAIGTSDAVEPLSGIAGPGEALPAPSRAWEEAWRRDTQEVVTESIHEFGRGMDQAIDRSLGQFRDSVDRAASQFESGMNRQFESGRQIRRAPMEPVR